LPPASCAGLTELEAGAFQYPPHLKGELLRRMKREHSRLNRELAPGDFARFLKRIGILFNEWWLRDVIFRPMPTIVTAEGNRFMFTKVIFDVLDRTETLTALHACPELNAGNGDAFDWAEPAGALTRSLGTIKLENNRLVLETISEERAERGRRVIEQVAGSAVRYRVTAYEDVEQTFRRARREPEQERPRTVPPQVQAEALRQYYDHHYRAWLDEPIPLFGGRTPRHAAKLKSQRANVVATLKSMENREAHAAREGCPTFDFSWLWEELRLERDGGQL
jgi:hypothetical protein